MTDELDTSPTAKIIDHFQGLTGLARAIDAPVSTVQGWRLRKRIPQEYWPKIIAAGAQRHVQIDVADFVFAPADTTPKTAVQA